ncbi:MAG: hypothetical protein MR038_03640 [Oscillospiraceae bacterium]|nr:hypothetical protein [Oscillospiraceae bacterium]
MDNEKNYCEDCEECDHLHNEIDDLINTVAEAIIDIAYENKDFVCGQCIRTARTLFALMDMYAREEDTITVIEQFAYITGISLTGD